MPKPWPGLASKYQKSDVADPDWVDPYKDADRLSGAELLARFPGTTTRARPRIIQGSLGFGLRMLYLPLGVEGTLDLYPLPWLRAGLVYSAGLSFKFGGETAAATFAQYGEAVVGLRFASIDSMADVDLQLRHSIGGAGEALPAWARPRKGDFADVVPIRLPSSHQFFVEGGALTGFIGLKKCTANCAEVTSEPTVYRELSRQLLIPFAGVRYVYYSEATIPRPGIGRVRYGQLFAHVLFHAFNQPRAAAYYLSGDAVKRSSLGMRVGLDLPESPFCLAALTGMRCAQGSISAGYTPFPGFVSFEFHVRFPIR